MSHLMVQTFPGRESAAAWCSAAAPWPRGATVAAAESHVLGDILRPDVNLAIWHRKPNPKPGPALRPLLARAPFTAVAEGPIEQSIEDLAVALPVLPPLDLLIDIQYLAFVFASVAATDGVVRLRLEALTGRGCHRWHADAVGLRLLCTYQGAGTEFLPLAGGAETARALDHDATGAATAAPTGAVALLKGEGYPGNAGWGCIHRSPPAGPGPRARLLLCIDQPRRIPLA